MYSLLDIGLAITPRGPAPRPQLLYSFDSEVPIPPRMPLSPGTLVQDELATRLRCIEGPLVEFGGPAQVATGHPHDDRAAVMMLTLQVLRTLRGETEPDLNLCVSRHTIANTALLLFGCPDSLWAPHPAWPHSKVRLFQVALEMFGDELQPVRDNSFFA